MMVSLRRTPLGGVLLLHWILWLRIVESDKNTLTINRHREGDMFTTEGISCAPDTCVLGSRITSGVSASSCQCQCQSELPVFRDDIRACVNDIEECPVAPFVSGSTSQKIPFVFLPLKGQIINPSAEILFTGATTPICVVTRAQSLSHDGWTELHNNSYTEPPFRLFRDEGRTYLMWLGEEELWIRMEGRLVLVYLMCREANKGQQSQDQTIFTPCVAFRVAGTPAIRGVMFEAPTTVQQAGLSVSEYIAIGVCSILLGLIYVASVFLYLHVRRRRKENVKDNEREAKLVASEEGVIKCNPLLTGSKNRHSQNSGKSNKYLNNDIRYDITDSGSCCSDTEPLSDVEQSSDEINNKSSSLQNKQVTSAMVHTCHMSIHHQHDHHNFSEPMALQETNSIERLPEENVSIIETPDGREERPDTVKAITNGTVRRKLYFNPAFFEPELLMAPPPAAIEFLTKIREVIAIAKHKMDTKKFSPTLMGIPEEDSPHNPLLHIETALESGAISLKRENSRRRECSGCPGCASVNEVPPLIRLKNLPCPVCSSCTESKQLSIRKWLENVPLVKGLTPAHITTDETSAFILPGLSTSLEITEKINHKRNPSSTKSQRKTPLKTKRPAPSPVSNTTSPTVANINNTKNQSHLVISKAKQNNSKNIKPEGEDRNTVSPGVTKLMSEVIKEMVVHRGLEPQQSSPSTSSQTLSVNIPTTEHHYPTHIEYESDSLERFTQLMDRNKDRGISTPSDYGDIRSQPSPSLSSALPLEEEMTMRNEIFNIKTGNKTISKMKNDTKPPPLQTPSPDDDYEVILLNPSADTPDKNMKLYALPQLLNTNGYSLVSEVYVNDGYKFDSSSSSPTSTSSASSVAKIRYDSPEDKPGHLTIEVEDSPQNYCNLREDSDDFEPDTLDRKPIRIKADRNLNAKQHTSENFTDSLERPVQIMLRTSGSFRSDSLSHSGSDLISQILAPSPLNRTFGSLREIYEQKTRYHHSCEADTVSLVGSTRSFHSDTDFNYLSWRPTDEFSFSVVNKGKIINTDIKESKRQRQPTPPGTIRNIINENASSNQILSKPIKENDCIYEDPPPPRPVFKDSTPPLPPRSFKPPLPPKNGKSRSTSQKRTVSYLARRPLPPLPKCNIDINFQDDSTISPSSTVSRDHESTSNMSGASADSLNYSDYEAFYAQPYSAGEDTDGTNTLTRKTEENLQRLKSSPMNNINSQFILKPNTTKLTQVTDDKKVKKSSEDKIKVRKENKVNSGIPTNTTNRQKVSKDVIRHMRDKRSSDSVKKSWRRIIERSGTTAPHKPEDSGYLSTDSNESHRRISVTLSTVTSQGPNSLSETDESLCDGASESGGESIATDSFFFGNFQKLSTCRNAESVDSGVGSDLINVLNNLPGHTEEHIDSSSDSENVSFVTVLPPECGRQSALRC